MGNPNAEVEYGFDFFHMKEGLHLQLWLVRLAFFVRV